MDQSQVTLQSHEYGDSGVLFDIVADTSGNVVVARAVQAV